MGIFSYGEDSLTLRLSHRLKEVLKKVNSLSGEERSEKLSDNDISYLVNSAAKWETFKHAIRAEKNTYVKVTAIDNQVYIDEVLNELITETDNLKAINFSNDWKTYRLAVQTDFILFSECSDIDSILAEIPRAIRLVRKLQDDFLKRKQKVNVEGFFEVLEKENISLKVLYDSDPEELKESYIAQKEAIIIDKKKEAQKLLDKLKCYKKSGELIE